MYYADKQGGMKMTGTTVTVDTGIRHFAYWKNV